jgi:hypothetical protein
LDPDDTPPAGFTQFAIDILSLTAIPMSGSTPQARTNYVTNTSPYISATTYEPIGCGGYYAGTLLGNNCYSERAGCGFIRNKATGLYTTLGGGGVDGTFVAQSGGSGWFGPELGESSIEATYRWNYKYPDNSVFTTSTRVSRMYYVLPTFPTASAPLEP